MDPAGVDYGELGAAGFGGELRVGEGGGVGLLLCFRLEAFDVFEAEDLAAAHEVDDVAGGAVDGVHANEVAFSVDADGVEAVVVDGFHEVQGVVGVAEGPAFIVGEDGGDVVELRDSEMLCCISWLRGEGEESECGGQEHTCSMRCDGRSRGAEWVVGTI
jgi:hypothetical protein